MNKGIEEIKSLIKKVLHEEEEQRSPTLLDITGRESMLLSGQVSLHISLYGAGQFFLFVQKIFRPACSS